MKKLLTDYRCKAIESTPFNMSSSLRQAHNCKNPSFYRRWTCLLLPLLVLLGGSPFSSGRESIRLDEWGFQRGPLKDPHTADWQPVTLPHDWSIAEAPREDAPSAGGGGYFPTGEGWYRLNLEIPEDWRGKRLHLHFEGAYRNATVWLNGSRIGFHASGYVPFRIELGEKLRFGAENEVLVHVDNRPQPNSRWYTGSGLYRPVWLEITEPVHFVPDSLQFRTRSISGSDAQVTSGIEVSNGSRSDRELTCQFHLRDPETGEKVASSEKTLSLKPGQSSAVTAELAVEAVRLWHPDRPHLYELVMELREQDRLVEQQVETVGIRTVSATASRGLLLNGEPILLYGGNVHHDHGPLGAAAYAAAEWRKVRLLKEAGFNALRTAHNPPSTAFLKACDHLGMLVIDEAFDGWKAKKVAHDYGEIWADNWEADLRAFVRRDRLHPSVIMWSIGNEVYERGSAAGILRAHQIAAVVRELDRDRPVTIGLNGLGESGDWSQLDTIFAAMDTAGYNYELADRHAADHERRPNRVMYASESYQQEVFTNWALMAEHSHIVGDFVWSAMDYLGESGIGRVFPPGEEARAHWEGEHFPWHGAWCGDLDLIGQRKPISHYREIVWDRGERLSAAVQIPAPGDGDWNPSQWALSPTKASWTWPGREGEPLPLEVYSRWDAVRVTVNGREAAEGLTGVEEAFKVVLEIPYKPGTLTVEGISGQKVVDSFSLETAGEPARLELRATTFSPPVAGAHTLFFVDVTVTDQEGIPHPLASPLIHYILEGPGEILGIGSGDLTSRQSYQANPRDAADGRALVVIRHTGEKNNSTPLRLKAQARGLESAEVLIP